MYGDCNGRELIVGEGQSLPPSQTFAIGDKVKMRPEKWYRYWSDLPQTVMEVVGLGPAPDLVWCKTILTSGPNAEPCGYRVGFLLKDEIEKV